jgi:hypothetical protein
LLLGCAGLGVFFLPKPPALVGLIGLMVRGPVIVVGFRIEMSHQVEGLIRR